MKQLSHSQINTYSQCGKKYYYHYINRLRSKTTTGALLFGSTLDITINTLLEDKKSNSVRPLEVYTNLFEKNWEFGEINKQKVNLKDTDLVVYAESDFDENLLPKNHDVVKYKKYIGMKKSMGLNNLYGDVIKFIGYTNWLCLLEKGKLMIKTYYNDFLPRINQVLSIQDKIELKDNNGNSVVGFCDAVLDIKDYGVIICDLKTSSKRYQPTSANISSQLAVYKHALSNRFPNSRVGFIVLYKKIQYNKIKICSKCSFNGNESKHTTCPNEINGSRCKGEWIITSSPEAELEFIPGTIDQYFEESVIENYEIILKNIENENFYRNWNACDEFSGCPYKSLCHKNDKSSLINIE